MNHPTESAFNEQLLQVISEAGFETLVRVVPDLSDTREIEEFYSAHRPEALAVGPLHGQRPTPFLRQLLRQRFPLIGFVGSEQFAGDLVTYEAADVVRLSLAHLRERGHVRLGGVGWSPVARAAFLAAPGVARRHWHKRWGSFANECEFALALELKTDSPTAYLFEDPCFALGFERGAFQRGLRIPADVAFVVNTQCEMGKFSPWSFTTVGPNLDEMTHKIVELVMGRICGEGPREYQTVTLESRLVCGESSGGARTDVRLGDPFLVARGPRGTNQNRNQPTNERQRS